MQLKEFKKTLQEKAMLISDNFLEQKKQGHTNHYGETYFTNTDFKKHYNPTKPEEIQYLKECYAYFDILREQRKDIPSNIHELSQYTYYPKDSDNELYCFLQNNSLEYLENKILRTWYYLFDFNGGSTKPGGLLQLYHKIFSNPLYEQYQRHFVTHLILSNIYGSKYSLGVEKNTLSLYEKSIIEKIKPFKNLDALQMELPYYGWLVNPQTAYNRIIKLFNKEPHIKLGFEKIAEEFNFSTI